MNSPVKKELFRTSQSWDGADLPDYPVGKPELVAMRYVFEQARRSICIITM